MSDLKAVLEQYDIDRRKSLDPLNEGRIYSARHKESGKELAVKIMETDLDWDKGQIEKVYKVAMQYHHPNLLTYQSVYRFVDGNWVSNYIFMEKSSGESLGNKATGQLKLGDKKKIATDIFAALNHLQAYGLVHQRLAPDHILLDRIEGTYRARLINYINATENEEQNFHLGAYECLAPEQIEEYLEVGMHTDIWALGVVLYYLFTGQYPFGQLTMRYSNKQIKTRILQADIPKLLVTIPQPFQNMVKKCLEKSPMDRWQDVQELSHYYESYLRRTTQVVQKNPANPTVSHSDSASRAAEPIEKFPVRRYRRKPSAPVRWWHIAIAFVLAGVLGYYLSKLTA